MDWLKIYSKTWEYWQTLAQSKQEWQVKRCVLAESYRAHGLFKFSWQTRSSWWWKRLRISFSATQWIICRWISLDGGIRVWWDEGQYEAHQSKEATKDFIHWYCLQSHMNSHEKESFHPIAFTPNIFSLEDETKSSLYLICKQKKNQNFYMLLQHKLENDFI